MLTLKDLGANSPIRLIGVQGEGSLPFSVRRDEIVTGGKIDLTFAYSPALIPELSHLTVLINGEVVGNIPLPKDKSSGGPPTLPINPVLFQQDNRILFRFIGHYTLGCEDPLHSSLWLVLSNTTKITTQLQKLPLPNDLSQLPAPFYDSKDMQASEPALCLRLEGRRTRPCRRRAPSRRGSARSPRTRARASRPASTRSPTPTLWSSRPIPRNRRGSRSPTSAGRRSRWSTNPNNSEAKLLLVLGRNADELRAAAETLALGSTALTGADAGRRRARHPGAQGL